MDYKPKPIDLSNLPDIGIHSKEPKETFWFKPTYKNGSWGCEFKLTLYFNSIKDLFRKRR